MRASLKRKKGQAQLAESSSKRLPKQEVKGRPLRRMVDVDELDEDEITFRSSNMPEDSEQDETSHYWRSAGAIKKLNENSCLSS